MKQYNYLNMLWYVMVVCCFVPFLFPHTSGHFVTDEFITGHDGPSKFAPHGGDGPPGLVAEDAKRLATARCRCWDRTCSRVDHVSETEA